VGFVDGKVQQVFAGIEAIPTTFIEIVLTTEL